MALKGIHRETNISQNDFLQSLYKEEPVIRSQVRFQYSKKKDMMTVLAQEKKAINSIYTKMYVEDDRVSIKPLFRDGKYL